MEIQKVRSRQIPSFEIEVDGCLDRHVLRLTLQPIIENCFKYAFPLGVKSDSYIRITAETVSKELLIRVADNGVGFDYYKDRASHFNKGLGIGLGNVDKRLKIAYGNAYGLTIDSESGTIVLIKVPLDHHVIDFK